MKRLSSATPSQRFSTNLNNDRNAFRRPGRKKLKAEKPEEWFSFTYANTLNRVPRDPYYVILVTEGTNIISHCYVAANTALMACRDGGWQAFWSRDLGPANLSAARGKEHRKTSVGGREKRSAESRGTLRVDALQLAGRVFRRIPCVLFRFARPRMKGLLRDSHGDSGQNFSTLPVW